MRGRDGEREDSMGRNMTKGRVRNDMRLFVVADRRLMEETASHQR